MISRGKRASNQAVCIAVFFILGLVLGLQPTYAEWPEKPIRIVVPFNAGGGTDVITRILADQLSRQMNQAVVVENKGGGAGMIGADFVAKAAPDGYIFLMGTGGVNSLSRIFVKNVPYETMKDFHGVAMIAGIPNVLTVNPSVPAKTATEFVAYVKANPGKLNYGASGNGSRMAMELFLYRAGIKITMVPYRGSAPAIQDLLKGDIQVIMDLLPSMKGMIDSGQLRALAITNKSPSAPNIPSLEESGFKGCEFLSWQGVFAPRKTPSEILNKFSEQINRALAVPEVQEKLRQGGANVMGGSPEQMDKFVKSEIAEFETVAQAANIKPE